MKTGSVWEIQSKAQQWRSFCLHDIPAIEKTVFLIDRKDLDTQTKMAFQSYADNDTIDVDETDNVTDLIRKLGRMMLAILEDIEKDRSAFAGKNVSEILSKMKKETVKVLAERFVRKWHVGRITDEELHPLSEEALLNGSF